MVALSEDFEIPTETALRVRAPSHTYKFGSTLCSKPSAKANLRRRIYDGCEQSESCSRDPIGYVDQQNSYAYVRGQSASALDPSGLLMDIPATPSKCKNAALALTLYGQFNPFTWDGVLWDHYMNGRGIPMTVPMDAFDPGGHSRTALANRMLSDASAKFANLSCGKSRTVFLGAPPYTQVFESPTLMINGYTLTGSGSITFKKKCGRCWDSCSLHAAFSFGATDTTDFDPYKSFCDPLGWVCMTDRLILACNLGFPFSISGSSTHTETFRVDCDSLGIPRWVFSSNIPAGE